MAISLVSSASCNCSAVSDDAPNRWVRWPASWCLSFLDQNRLRLHFGQQKCGERPQFRRVFLQRFGDIQHEETIAKQAVYGNPKTAKPSIYPAVKGRQVRSGKRQSIPSSSIANCAGVSAILPSFADGQTNRPFSSRFENRQAPWLRHCRSDQWRDIGSPTK